MEKSPGGKLTIPLSALSSSQLTMKDGQPVLLLSMDALKAYLPSVLQGNDGATVGDDQPPPSGLPGPSWAESSPPAQDHGDSALTGQSVEVSAQPSISSKILASLASALPKETAQPGCSQDTGSGENEITDPLPCQEPEMRTADLTDESSVSRNEHVATLANDDVITCQNVQPEQDAGQIPMQVHAVGTLRTLTSGCKNVTSESGEEFPGTSSLKNCSESRASESSSDDRSMADRSIMIGTDCASQSIAVDTLTLSTATLPDSQDQPSTSDHSPVASTSVVNADFSQLSAPTQNSSQSVQQSLAQKLSQLSKSAMLGSPGQLDRVPPGAVLTPSSRVQANDQQRDTPSPRQIPVTSLPSQRPSEESPGGAPVLENEQVLLSPSEEEGPRLVIQPSEGVLSEYLAGRLTLNEFLASCHPVSSPERSGRKRKEPSKGAPKYFVSKPSTSTANPEPVVASASRKPSGNPGSKSYFDHRNGYYTVQLDQKSGALVPKQLDHPINNPCLSVPGKSDFPILPNKKHLSYGVSSNISNRSDDVTTSRSDRAVIDFPFSIEQAQLATPPQRRRRKKVTDHQLASAAMLGPERPNQRVRVTTSATAGAVLLEQQDDVSLSQDPASLVVTAGGVPGMECRSTVDDAIDSVMASLASSTACNVESTTMPGTTGFQEGGGFAQIFDLTTPLQPRFQTKAEVSSSRLPAVVIHGLSDSAARTEYLDDVQYPVFDLTPPPPSDTPPVVDDLPGPSGLSTLGTLTSDLSSSQVTLPDNAEEVTSRKRPKPTSSVKVNANFGGCDDIAVKKKVTKENRESRKMKVAKDGSQKKKVSKENPEKVLPTRAAKENVDYIVEEFDAESDNRTVEDEVLSNETQELLDITRRSYGLSESHETENSDDETEPTPDGRISSGNDSSDEDFIPVEQMPKFRKKAPLKSRKTSQKSSKNAKSSKNSKLKLKNSDLDELGWNKDEWGSDSDADESAKTGSDFRHQPLPPEMEGLLGQANLCLVQGKPEAALKMVGEVIRQAPRHPAPYEILSAIYGQVGDLEKQLHAGIMAVSLKHAKASGDQWLTLLELAEKLDDGETARKCLEKGFKCDPLHPIITSRLSDMLKWEGDELGLLLMQQHRLQHLAPELTLEELTREAKEIGTELYRIGRVRQAKGIWTYMLQKQSEANEVSFLDLYNYVELLAQLHHYDKIIIECFTYGNVTGYTLDGVVVTKAEINSTMWEKLARFEFDPNFAVDLIVKLCVAFVRLSHFRPAKAIIQHMFSVYNMDTEGDLFHEIAGALKDVHQHSAALKLTEALLKSAWPQKTEDMYHRHAVCLEVVGEPQRAIEAYEALLRYFPSNTAGRISLATLLTREGYNDAALSVLGGRVRGEQEPRRTAGDTSGLEDLDERLLFQRLTLLEPQMDDDGDLEEHYIECAMVLFAQHCRSILESGGVPKGWTSWFVQANVQYLVTTLTSLGTDLHERVGHQPEYPPCIDVDECYRFFVKTARLLHARQDWPRFAQLACYGYLNRPFIKLEEKTMPIVYFVVFSLHRTRHFSEAFKFVRNEFWDSIKVFERPMLWNLIASLYATLCRPGDTSIVVSRFILRLARKRRAFYPLQVLNAHTSLASGMYVHATAEFASIARRKPDLAFVHLMLAVTYSQIACQKHASRKQDTAMQAMAYLNLYQKQRPGQCKQEVSFNMARLLHQIGLVWAALPLYRRALECEPVTAPLPSGTVRSKVNKHSGATAGRSEDGPSGTEISEKMEVLTVADSGLIDLASVKARPLKTGTKLENPGLATVACLVRPSKPELDASGTDQGSPLVGLEPMDTETDLSQSRSPIVAESPPSGESGPHPRSNPHIPGPLIPEGSTTSLVEHSETDCNPRAARGSVDESVIIDPLTTRSKVTTSSADPESSAMVRFDLRPDAAFNMALIYRHSGNDQVADDLLRKYCSV